MNPFHISYTHATVTHSNKYNQNVGFVISMFFFSNFLQDVAFKLDDSGDEFRTTFKNLNLPLFTGQKVTLIAINDNVIAYIDKSTNAFHYLTNNLQKDLNYGFKIHWIRVIFLSVAIALAASTVLPTNKFNSLIIPVLLFGVWVYQRVTNFVLEKKIDHLITSS